MAEHRVSMLRTALRRYPDPATSRDPRTRALVGQLRALGADPRYAPAPDETFRSELRAQLVAVAPRLVRDGETLPATAAAATAEPRSRRAWRASGARLGLPGLPGLGGAAAVGRLRIGRTIRLGIAALCVFALLLAGAVWISHRALPGDALYSLKRASESAQLSFTSGDTDRAKEYLSFAKTRVDEVASLLGKPSAMGSGPQAAAGPGAHTAKLVGQTLDSADSDVRHAAQLLGAKAVRDRSTGPLAVMTAWAPEQVKRLGELAAAVPSGATHQRLVASQQLVSAALDRAEALRSGITCACLATAPTDGLGPVPCTACSDPGPATAPQTPSGSVPAQPSRGSVSTHETPGRTSPGAGTATTPPGAPANNEPRTRTTGGTSSPPTSTRPGGTAAVPPAQPGDTDTTRPGTPGGETSQPGGTETTPTPIPTPSPSKTCIITLLGICI